MAQKMIEIMFKEKLRDCGIQTESKRTPDFSVQLAKNKFIKLYQSRVYNDYILTINTNHSKKIVITRSMWKIFRLFINQIDSVLNS